MSSAMIGSAIRIGLIGLGHTGASHLERLGSRSDVKVVAAFDADPGRRDRGLPFCREVSTRIEDLFARDDLDSVLVTAPLDRRAELARLALERGRNVAIEPPVGRTLAEVRQLLAAAQRSGKNLIVIPTRRGDLDFRAAFDSVRQGQLGLVKSARLLSWTKAVSSRIDGPGNETDPNTEVATEDQFTGFAYQYVDQLLQLVSEKPWSVFARRQLPRGEALSEIAFTLSIRFQDGADALVDVNLGSNVLVQSGWILSGTSGDYRSQRLYVADATGEICDTPLARPDSPIDVYAILFASLRSESSDLRSAREAIAVMQVIEAARESAATGRVVQLPVE